ncbi:hypothetical protein [Laceyella putida]|uniref:Uncharacterized protein n=1 Tax=Laceyella putida TaxID=110101 RepID=A0ABW2RR91_9BACL
MKLFVKTILLGSILFALSATFSTEPVWPSPPAEAQSYSALDDDPVWP